MPAPDDIGSEISLCLFGYQKPRIEKPWLTNSPISNERNFQSEQNENLYEIQWLIVTPVSAIVEIWSIIFSNLFHAEQKLIEE